MPTLIRQFAVLLIVAIVSAVVALAHERSTEAEGIAGKPDRERLLIFTEGWAAWQNYYTADDCKEVRAMIAEQAGTSTVKGLCLPAGSK